MAKKGESRKEATIPIRVTPEKKTAYQAAVKKLRKTMSKDIQEHIDKRIEESK